MKKVIICNNFRSNPSKPSCSARGSKAITEAITHEVNTHQLDIEIEHVKCLGMCERGPNVKLAPLGPFIEGVDNSQIPKLIEKIRAFTETPIKQ